MDPLIYQDNLWNSCSQNNIPDSFNCYKIYQKIIWIMTMSHVALFNERIK